MLNFISKFVSAGRINSQEAYLFLLIDSGVKEKEDMSKKTNLSIRTVERQLKSLVKLDLIKKDFSGWSTKISLVSVDHNNKVSSNIDINDLNQETKDAVVESSLNLNVNKDLLLSKIKEILGDKEIIPEVLIKASKHTISELNNKSRLNPVRHPLAFFLGIVRNMYKNGMAQLLSIKQDISTKWNKVKIRLKKYLSKPSYNLINKIIAKEDNNVLHLYVLDKNSYDFISDKYLGSIMYYASRENILVDLHLVN